MLNEKLIQEVERKYDRLLFFGGPYSNLQALQALKKWAEENNIPPNNIFCTGDALGYCAQPLETIKFLQEWKIYVITGNVELQLRNNREDCGCDFTPGGRCDAFSHNWYAYTKDRMTKPYMKWLHSLPNHVRFYFGRKMCTVLHGSWHNPSEFIFKSTPWAIKELNLKESVSEVIVAGHSGLPFIDSRGGLIWANAGVIGMPANNGKNKTWFMTGQADGDDVNFEFHELEYDYHTTSQLMREKGLPVAYANTLETGIWDNCEILPEEETLQQGKELIF